MRRLLAAAALVPTALAITLVRPAAATGPGYDQVSLTAVASGVRTGGVVGASGGLVTLDTGSAYVTARLDGSPSSAVLAAPFEPGTLARTLVGQGNGAAGEAVFDVPDAEASYPGAQTTGTCCGAPAVDQAPVTFGAGQASATAGPSSAKGSATGAAYGIAGAVDAGPSTSAIAMTTDTAEGSARQTATTTVSKITVAGVLSLNDVVATASTKADGDTHSATQSLSIGGATVSGQAVEISNDGVTAVGTPVVPGMRLEAATTQANAQLTGAGIVVHTVGGRTTHDQRSASADTGGVAIELATPDLPGGVAANTLRVVVGGVVLTETDTLVAPAVVLPPDAPLATPDRPGTASTTTTTVIPGTPGTLGSPNAPVSTFLPPVLAAQPASYAVQGHRIDKQTALLAFGAWQMLTLGTATLYAFVERKRRLQALGRLL